jgi:hypothetical protein
MQKYWLALGVIVMVIFPTSMANAQSQAANTASCQIYANIIPAYAAVKNEQLSFGTFTPGNNGGKLILAPQGELLIKGSISSKKEIHRSASYYVVGDSSTVFSVSLPQTPAKLINDRDLKALYVSNWESTLNYEPDAKDVQAGVHKINVGATLEVGTPAENPRGIYSGKYTITFDFN